MAMATLALALTATVVPARAHHVGAYTVRDNEVSQNFKQIKFALQARKLDVAARLYDDGAVRREMTARAAQLPAGLEAATRTALRAGDVPRAEAGLAALFAALARDLAVEANRRVTDEAMTPEARLAAATRFLEAIWRYWNLIDFVASQRDPKAAVAIRLAYDEAESLTRSGASERPASSPVAANPCAGPRPKTPPRPAADPARLRAPFGRIAETLDSVVQTLETVTRRN